MIDYKNLRIEIRSAVVCASRVTFKLTSPPKQDLNKFQDRTKINIIMTHADNNVDNIKDNNSVIRAKKNNNLFVENESDTIKESSSEKNNKSNENQSDKIM